MKSRSRRLATTPAPAPGPARPTGELMLADPASDTALARLQAGLEALTARAVLPPLRRALAALQADRYQEGAEAALGALRIDERCGPAWHVLAVCREKVGDFASSLSAYETALTLTPEDPDIANNLGQLAYRLGMKEVAEQLFRHYLAASPGSTEGANNLACALRDQMRFGEAVEAIRPAILAHPGEAMLWNTLATVLVEQGELPQAIGFLDEAVRLEPRFGRARYNRANTRLALDDLEGAEADIEAAVPHAASPADKAMMGVARAFVHLARGEVAEGWRAYRARRDPFFAECLAFAVDAPAWTPETPLAGRRLLVIGEQGLGDEVLFANLLPDVVQALKPRGRLTLAVEARLVPLFARSLPAAEVGAHVTGAVDGRRVRAAQFLSEPQRIDSWAPLADLLERFRPTPQAFPAKAGYLRPDPERVAHWRGMLARTGRGPAVGVTWKSLAANSARARYYAPFDAWRAALRTPGARFVNLQYGDGAAEIAHARDAFGVELWTPPGIDLKNDLDDLSALCCALDLVIGPANATTNLAGACGAALWLISVPAAWTRLGRPNYPWYPQARVFAPAVFGDWGPVMGEVAQALAAFVTA